MYLLIHAYLQSGVEVRKSMIICISSKTMDIQLLIWIIISLIAGSEMSSKFLANDAVDKKGAECFFQNVRMFIHVHTYIYTHICLHEVCIDKHWMCTVRKPHKCTPERNKRFEKKTLRLYYILALVGCLIQLDTFPWVKPLYMRISILYDYDRI